MELFIRIVDGQPYEHPIFGDNFREAFPHIDVYNLPSDFAKFVRVAPPVLGVYEVNTGCEYKFEDGVVKDVWNVRPMTLSEKTDKQNLARLDWQERNGHASWVLDLETCIFEPPVPYPGDETNHYIWVEKTLSWFKVPEPPDYENTYQYMVDEQTWRKIERL